MGACADLDIGLHRRDDKSYSIELSFSQPESDADIRPLRDRPLSVHFDLDQLRVLIHDDLAYGKLLSKYLFADSNVWTAFSQAQSTAQALDVPLRLRLYIGPSAPELHTLRWETLCDPEDGSPLFMCESILFSRYLGSRDWRPVRLLSKTELRALVVIANPANLTDYEPGGRKLAALDVQGELARVKSSLGSMPMTLLAPGGEARATLDNLSARLREGYDVLYLTCHGALIHGEPHLWLEDDAGNVEVVPGSEWITRLREVWQRPRLVVLASCQSAGKGAAVSSDDRGVFSPLGPQLAELGIPAVLAMQDNVQMHTVEQFMPVFFEELRRDGQIDRAMSVARGRIRHQIDWWVPVLYMRLKSGRLWYESGFADAQGEMEKWPTLLRHIKNGKCTPILGPGLTESLLGSRREIAQRWADTYHFPMQSHNREDLPQVAQYLAVNQDYSFPRDELVAYLRQEILRRYSRDLPGELEGVSLDELITAIGAHRREGHPTEFHQVLAMLPLPIYLTTNPSNLLTDALVAAGKDPRVDFCRWNEDIEHLPSVYDDEPDYRPDARRPLIYHLLGRLQEPDSIVLTEDDYFDYLIGATRDKDLIPGVVRRALADTALLFLGFQMDDWNFRVFFRSIMRQEGRRRRRKYAHVAVQIDPEEGRILEPERARRYLESYFQDADISIYWGSVEDFSQELDRRWKEGTP